MLGDFPANKTLCLSFSSMSLVDLALAIGSDINTVKSGYDKLPGPAKNFISNLANSAKNQMSKVAKKLSQRGSVPNPNRPKLLGSTSSHTSAPNAVGGSRTSRGMKETVVTENVDFLALGVAIGGAAPVLSIPVFTAAGNVSYSTSGIMLNPATLIAGSTAGSNLGSYPFGPNIAKLAACYSEFRVTRMELEYKPACSSLSDGDIIFAYSPEPDQSFALFTPGNILASYKANKDTNVWMPLRYNIPNLDKSWKKILMPIPYTVAEMRQSTAGALLISAATLNSTNVGKQIGSLYVKATLQFRSLGANPLSGTNVSLSNSAVSQSTQIETCTTALTTATAAAPLISPAAFTFAGPTLLQGTSSNLLIFAQPGQYSVTMTWTGALNIGADPTVTLSTPVTYVPGTINYSLGCYEATKAMLSFVVTFTGTQYSGSSSSTSSSPNQVTIGGLTGMTQGTPYINVQLLSA